MMESDIGTGTGRRARNKSDKLRRIKESSYELFSEKGYDQTTMREIAGRAGVALGTIFTYASDKRDLLFLIFNDRQDELRRASFAAIPENAGFGDQVEALFTPFYYHFSTEPAFTRYLLRELTFFKNGIQSPRFQEGRLSIVKRIRELVEEAAASGRLTPGNPSQHVAEMIFGLYQSELRLWLSGTNPAVKDGLKRLREAFDILIAGLANPRGD
jgi:AcrR family transcriptional regulator